MCTSVNDDGHVHTYVYSYFHIDGCVPVSIMTATNAIYFVHTYMHTYLCINLLTHIHMDVYQCPSCLHRRPSTLNIYLYTHILFYMLSYIRTKKKKWMCTSVDHVHDYGNLLCSRQQVARYWQPHSHLAVCICIYSALSPFSIRCVFMCVCVRACVCVCVL